MKAYFINDEKNSIQHMNVPNNYVETLKTFRIAEVGIIIPGQRVITSKGKEGVILGPGMLPEFIDIEFDTGEIDTFDYRDLDYMTPPIPADPQCECGSSKVGSDKHSTWCPLYKKE